MIYTEINEKSITVYYAYGEIVKAIFSRPEYNWKTDRDFPIDATFIFRNGNSVTNNGMIDTDLIVGQYRWPVSPDGKRLFVQGWGHGMFAYSVNDGTILWKNKVRRQNGEIIVYRDTVLGISCENKLVKVSSINGSVLKTMQICPHKCCLLDITTDYCVAQTHPLEWSIIDKKTFEIVQTFDDSVVPKQYILDSFVSNGKLIAVTKHGNTVDSVEIPIYLSERVRSNEHNETVNLRLSFLHKLYGLNIE